MHILGRAAVVVRRTCKHVEARGIDGAHLIGRQPDVALLERLVVILDREHLIRADRVHRNACGPKATEEILLELGIGHGIMRDNVDLRADDLAILNKRTPARIGQRPHVIGGENIRPLDSVCLAVFVEFLKGRLVDGERGNPRCLRLRQDILCGQSLARGKLKEPLIVDGKLHRARLFLNRVALHADDEARNESNEDRRQEDRMIVKFLHV